MPTYFIAVEEKKDKGWTMGHFGNSAIDGLDYTLTTNGLHADQVPLQMTDAKTSAEFIAGLINAWYNDIDVRGWETDRICSLGVLKEEIPHPANSVLPFSETDLERKLPF